MTALERIEVSVCKIVKAGLFIQCVSLIFKAALSIIFGGNGMESPILSDASIRHIPQLPPPALGWPIQPSAVITLPSPALFPSFAVYHLSRTQLNDT